MATPLTPTSLSYKVQPNLRLRRSYNITTLLVFGYTGVCQTHMPYVLASFMCNALYST